MQRWRNTVFKQHRTWLHQSKVLFQFYKQFKWNEQIKGIRVYIATSFPSYEFKLYANQLKIGFNTIQDVIKN